MRIARPHACLYFIQNLIDKIYSYYRNEWGKDKFLLLLSLFLLL